MRIKVNQVMPKDGFKQPWLKAIILDGEIKEQSVYELILIDEQTDQQRKLFNPLCRLYFDSLCYQRVAVDWLDLRDQIKLKLGAGYETIRFTTSDYAIHEIPYKEKNDIPKDVIEDYRKGNEARVQLILKSMRDYSKKEMTDITDSLIREMITAGVGQSSKAKRFNEILEKIKFQE